MFADAELRTTSVPPRARNAARPPVGRRGPAAQHRLAEMIDASPRVVQQRALARRVNGAAAPLQRVPERGGGVVQRVGRPELEDAFRVMRDEAMMARLPSLDEARGMNALILDRDPEARQRAIGEAVRAYGIGFRNDDAMAYRPDLRDTEAETVAGRAPDVGPAAFTGGSLAHLRLALTLTHENLHRQQYRRIGEVHLGNVPSAKRNQVTHEETQAIRKAMDAEYYLREVLAYESELANVAAVAARWYPDGEVPPADQRQLDRFERDAREERDDHRRELLARLSDAQAELFETGDLAGLVLSLRAGVREDAIRVYGEELAGKEPHPEQEVGEEDEGPPWDELAEATALLYDLQDTSVRLLQRPHSRILRNRWRMTERALERRWERDSRFLGHWWLASTPARVAGMDVRAEVTELIRSDLGVEPPDGFWDAVEREVAFRHAPP